MPELGRAIRHEWALDESWLTVNHGSFGATPLSVLAAQQEWRRRMEAQPTRFMSRLLPDALRAAAEKLGAFLGVRGEDLAFLENATTGCNAVLRSFRLQPGDDVLVLSHAYGAVRNTVRYVTDRAGARMVEAAIPFPRPPGHEILAALALALTPQTRLAVLDHITSSSALVLPLADMVGLCHAKGVPVLVDGAHGPGQIDLDIPATGAGWYTGNCHKWLCAPKGSAFLWAAPGRQSDLHPVVISHGLGRGFLAEFDWTGTRDPTAFLAVPDAIDFCQRLGGAQLRARNHALAVEATALLARHLGTETGAEASMMAAMGLVRLPVAEEVSQEHAHAMRSRLLDAGTDAPLHVHARRIWLRLSAHAYHDVSDYSRLAQILAGLLSVQP